MRLTYTAKQLAIMSDLEKHEEDLHGLTLINPRPPICTAITKGKPGRPPGRCTLSAVYVTADGQELCTTHAVRWAESHHPVESMDE